MIPYILGKLAPNSSHLTRGLVKYVPGRGYFCAVFSQNGDNYVTSPPPSIVELVAHELTPASGLVSHQQETMLELFYRQS